MDPKWDEDQPIYRQLRDRVVAMILEGVLGDGVTDLEQAVVDVFDQCLPLVQRT